MKKILLIFSLFSLIFLSACNSGLNTNEKIRISGIIDACKNNTQQMQPYLNKKVKQNEITETVSFTIYECLKDYQVKK